MINSRALKRIPVTDLNDIYDVVLFVESLKDDAIIISKDKNNLPDAICVILKSRGAVIEGNVNKDAGWLIWDLNDYIEDLKEVLYVDGKP